MECRLYFLADSDPIRTSNPISPTESGQDTINFLHTVLCTPSALYPTSDTLHSTISMRSPCDPPPTPSFKSSEGPAHTTIFDDTSHEISSPRLAATATPQDIVHGQENLSLTLTQAQSGSPCSEVTIPEADPLAQNQIGRMSAIPQVAKVSDGILAGNIISGSSLGHAGRSHTQAHQGSSMAGPVNATIAGTGPGYQLSPHDQVLQISVSQTSSTAASTSVTLVAGAGDSYPFQPQHDSQAMQVYQTSSMAGSTSATFSAGAGASYPFSPQQNPQAMQAYQASSMTDSTIAALAAGASDSYPFPPQHDSQAMQVYRTSPMAGFTSATLAAGASNGYPFSPHQGSQMHVLVSRASSMADFVNVTLDGNTNAACVFSPDPGHVQHRDIHWTFGTYEERPPNQRYSADEKTTIRCLLENGLSHSKIKKLTGSPKATTNRFSRKPSQVQMMQIQSTKLQDTCFFVLRVCPKLGLAT